MTPENGPGVRHFRLYVAGESPNSSRALANFEALRRRFPEGARYELEVVDVLEQPARAVADGVLITPTLICPEQPGCRLVGTLSDAATVLSALFGEGAGLPEVRTDARMQRLARRLSEVEANLEALLGDHADAVLHPDGVPMLLRQAQEALKRSAAVYRHLAGHDALTDLPNRTVFFSRLEHAIEHARRYERGLAVLYLDLDRFKAVNDAWGHRAGDALLRAFAERLRHRVRGVDTVARIGGDEFAVLLENLQHTADAGRLAAKIIAEVSRPLVVEGHTLTPSTSIGIGLYPEDGDDALLLVDRADDAMYRAKARGRGNFVYYGAAHRAGETVPACSLAELRAALARGDIELHYQSELERASRRIVGMEALLRWRHAEHGLLPADALLAAAERAGFMPELDDWVLRSAAGQALAWQRAGYGLRVTVNLSAQQVRDVALAQRLRALLAELGGAATAPLVFEIHERLLPAAEANAAAFAELAGAGVALSVDECCNSLASLHALHTLPIARLKVRCQGAQARGIAEGLIHIGHGLGITVGVKNIEDGESLAGVPAAVDELQGFYLGRVMPAANADEMLARQSG